MSVIAEQKIIGTLLTHPEMIKDITNDVTAEMFSDELLGRIYVEFQRGFDNGYEVNLVVLEQKLSDTDYPKDIILKTVTNCMSMYDIAGSLITSANTLVASYKAKSATKILSEIKLSPNNINGKIGMLINELEALQKNEKSDASTVAEMTDRYKDLYFCEKEDNSLKIGLSMMDEYLNGLEPGDTICIGARPSVGKSAFATQIAMNLAKQGKRVGFYNLEMSDKQMYERFIVNESGISLTRLRKAVQFLGDEKEKFENANKVLKEKDNLVVHTGSKKVGQIRAEAKNMDYDIIIIDYLQLLTPESTYRGNRVQEVGEISRSLKRLAKELKIPIIMLSQLNRCSEHTETKEPTMADLRETGDIEQDASVIILLWKLSQSDPRWKGCKIDKNRQGLTGTVVLEFNGDVMRFQETKKSVDDIAEFEKVDNARNTPFG